MPCSRRLPATRFHPARGRRNLPSAPAENGADRRGWIVLRRPKILGGVPGDAAEARRPELALLRQHARCLRIGSGVRRLGLRVVDDVPPQHQEIREVEPRHIGRCGIRGVEDLHPGMFRRSRQQVRELRNERLLVLEQVPPCTALERRRVRTRQDVQNDPGDDAQSAERDPRELQRRPAVHRRRVRVNRGDVSVGAENCERGSSLGKDRGVHGAAMHVNCGHSADGEEPAGGDRFEHQVMSSEKGVDRVFANTRVHGDLIRAGSQCDAVISDVDIARHVDQVGGRCLRRGAPIVVGNQGRLGVPLPRCVNRHALLLGPRQHRLQFIEISRREAVLLAVARRQMPDVPAPVLPVRHTVRWCGAHERRLCCRARQRASDVTNSRRRTTAGRARVRGAADVAATPLEIVGGRVGDLCSG